MTETMTVDNRHHVAHIVFSNPPLNHATVSLMRALGDTLAELDRDPECRAILLSSEGKQFCAGADLVAASGGGVGGSGADPLWEFYEQALRVFACRKPIVAAIQGAAVGAGFGLAVAADIRVAAPDARFVANFTKLGFHPGFALTYTLPRLIGAHRANLMFLTGRRFKPEEVLHWGLVDEIAAPHALLATARRWASEIAENAPLALLATRETARADLLAAATAALKHEHAVQSRLQLTADYAEGVRAVSERRAGEFKGR